MSNQVTILSATTITLPFSGIACDVYGNQCQYIGSATTIPHIFNLPPLFDTAPTLLLKLIDSQGCEISEITNCDLD